MIMAIAGKGGSGKTTLAALIVRALKEEKRGSILAIDADPNRNLGEALGMEGGSTIVDIIDSISKNPGQIPPGITKDRFIGLKVEEALDEGEGFDLLTMGRPEGPGCYCFANNMLRDLIKKLMDSYAYIVIDNEAGMEHLSRRLVREIDSFFIVSDASAIGIRSAARISHLADELNITVKEKCFVLNKSKGKEGILDEEINKTGLNLKIVLPFDEEIENAAIRNKPIFDISSKNILVSETRKLVTPCLRMGNVPRKETSAKRNLRG